MSIVNIFSGFALFTPAVKTFYKTPQHGGFCYYEATGKPVLKHPVSPQNYFDFIKADPLDNITAVVIMSSFGLCRSFAYQNSFERIWVSKGGCLVGMGTVAVKAFKAAMSANEMRYARKNLFGLRRTITVSYSDVEKLSLAQDFGSDCNNSFVYDGPNDAVEDTDNRTVLSADAFRGRP